MSRRRGAVHQGCPARGAAHPLGLLRPSKKEFCFPGGHPPEPPGRALRVLHLLVGFVSGGSAALNASTSSV